MNKGKLLFQKEFKQFFKTYKKGFVMSLLIHIGLLTFIGHSFTASTNEQPPLITIQNVLSISLLFLFLLSLQTIDAQIYNFKDKDILLPLPITKNDILFGKFASYYLYHLLSTTCLLLPLFTKMHLNIPIYLLTILTLCIPANLFATLLIALLTKLNFSNKAKSYFHQILTLFIIVAINVRKYLHLVKFPTPLLLSQALANNNYTSLLIYIAYVLIGFFILLKIIQSQFFLETTTHATKQKTYDQDHHTIPTQFQLFRRIERNRLFDIPAYLMNTTLGALIILAFPIGFCFLSQDHVLFELVDHLYLYLILANLATITINTSAISIEGPHLDILKSLPINANTLIQAKITNSFLFMIIPATISYLVGSIFLFHYTPFAILLGLLLILLESYSISSLYLYINLNHANTHFSDITAAIKQSKSTMFGALYTFIHFILHLVLPQFVPNNVTLTILFTLSTILACIVTYNLKKHATTLLLDIQ